MLQNENTRGATPGILVTKSWGAASGGTTVFPLTDCLTQPSTMVVPQELPTDTLNQGLLDHGIFTGPASVQPPSRPRRLIVPDRNKDKAALRQLLDFGRHLWLSCNIDIA